MIIFLKELQIGSLEELNDQIQELTDQQNMLKASIRETQNRMKEINRQRQAIRNYSRTKEVYTRYRESGWSVKFYQEQRQEIEDHRNAQAVYAPSDPTDENIDDRFVHAVHHLPPLSDAIDRLLSSDPDEQKEIMDHIRSIDAVAKIEAILNEGCQEVKNSGPEKDRAA